MIQSKEKATIGRVERIGLPELFDMRFYARIDTGAKKSAIWVSKAEVVEGILNVIFFDKGVEGYTGEVVIFKHFDRVVVASSNGHVTKRYTVKLVVVLSKRRIKATFTLADRSTQVYPILIGRNVLRSKFIVDVQFGRPAVSKEKQRTIQLRSNLSEGEKI